MYKIGIDIDGVIAKTDEIWKNKYNIKEYNNISNFWAKYNKMWQNYKNIPIRKEYTELLKYDNVFIASNRPSHLIPYTYLFFEYHGIELNNLIILPTNISKLEFFDLIIDDSPNVDKAKYPDKIWLMPVRYYNQYKKNIPNYAGTDKKIIEIVRKILDIKK